MTQRIRVWLEFPGDCLLSGEEKNAIQAAPRLDDSSIDNGCYSCTKIKCFGNLMYSDDLTETELDKKKQWELQFAETADL